MKNRIALFVVLVLCSSFLSACNSDMAKKSAEGEMKATVAGSLQDDQISTTIKKVTVGDIKNPHIIEESNYYKVIEGDGHYYYYFIYDRQGNVVDENGYYWRNPQLSMLNDRVVKVYTHMGTGVGAIRTRYYNAESDILTNWFNGVYDETSDLIAYGYSNTLYVQKIFDKDALPLEIEDFSKNVSDKIDPFIDVKFINDGKQLSVSYRTADDDTTTDVFSTSDGTRV